MPGKRSSEKRKSTSIEVLFCVFRRLYRIFIQMKMTYHYFLGGVKTGFRSRDEVYGGKATFKSQIPACLEMVGLRFYLN